MHFGLASSRIIVTNLISAAFGGAAIIRGEALILMWITEDAALIRGRPLV